MVHKDWTHIIIGAGAAGCVLAYRLAKNSDFNVLLIEAGGAGSMDPTLSAVSYTHLTLPTIDRV